MRALPHPSQPLHVHLDPPRQQPHPLKENDLSSSSALNRYLNGVSASVSLGLEICLCEGAAGFSVVDAVKFGAAEAGNDEAPKYVDESGVYRDVDAK
jgi:hypothetical protein